MRNRKSLRVAVILLSMFIGATVHAQILIGQSAGFSGPVAAAVKELTDGAKLYFDAINAKGGVGGQQIELISLDDKFEPKLTVENTRLLIEQRNVVAMFLTRGTPHNEAIIPLLDQYGVPLIAPSTGAMLLHQPVRKHVFNVRASYQREAEKAITHMATIGINRIALVVVDDTFGLDALVGAQKGMDAAKLKPVLVEKIDKSMTPDFSKIAPLIKQTDAQTVLIVGTGVAVVTGVKAIRAAGSSAQVVTLSNNASGGFIKSLGKDAPGIIVTQVFPQSIGFVFVKEAMDMARAKDIPDVSPIMLEGFASAKVMVEALRRTGGKPTRERIQAALEGMTKFDLGGLEVSYSTKDHTGLDFADLSIITDGGKFRR
jgi:branched-chain amino acid transport system substrate-binding protein